MAWSLTDIQTQISSEIDGNASISSTSSEWGARLAPINRSLFDWGDSYDWSQLKKIHNGAISTATGNASYALPADFKRTIGYVKVAYDSQEDFPINPPEWNYRYTDTDRYVNILGNDYDNKVLFIHGVTLSSGTSIQFTYFASPISLSSTGQLTECPDPTFLVQRTLYYIYKSREDARFPEAKVEADKILARMIENENTKGLGYVDRSVPVTPLVSFRIGRDG